MKLDNIVVLATADKYDEFGQKAEETLSKVEFASELNTTINQPNEGEPVHKLLRTEQQVYMAAT